jgi:hypothetical protein
MLPVPPLDDHEEAHAAFAAPVQVLAEVLGALGLSADNAVPVIGSLRSALHGFVSLEAGGGFGVPDSVDHSFDVLVEMVIAGVLAHSKLDRPRKRRGRARSPVR